MPTITLKDIPEKLHKKLKTRAKLNGRSLNKEAIACLEEVVRGDERPSPDEILEMAREIRERSPLYLTDAKIRRGKEWGRK